jgi:hypothetical protein
LQDKPRTSAEVSAAGMMTSVMCKLRLMTKDGFWSSLYEPHKPAEEAMTSQQKIFIY